MSAYILFLSFACFSNPMYSKILWANHPVYIMVCSNTSFSMSPASRFCHFIVVLLRPTFMSHQHFWNFRHEIMSLLLRSVFTIIFVSLRVCFISFDFRIYSTFHFRAGNRLFWEYIVLIFLQTRNLSILRSVQKCLWNAIKSFLSSSDVLHYPMLHCLCVITIFIIFNLSSFTKNILSFLSISLFTVFLETFYQIAEQKTYSKQHFFSFCCLYH